MISTEYQITLRQMIVQDFVRENNRAPSAVELDELVAYSQARLQDVDNIGISGYNLVKPKFRGKASATDENTNRRAIHLDLMTLNYKLDRMIQEEEHSYRNVASSVHRANQSLSALEHRLDNLLKNYNETDPYLYGIEETFSTQEAVQLDLTTASVQPNSVTIGKRKLENVNLKRVKLKLAPTSDKGFLSWVGSASDILKADNGETWSGEVRTSYQIGRVSLVFDLDFPEAIDISSVKLMGLPIETSKIATVTCLHSVNGTTFDVSPIVEQRLLPTMVMPVDVLKVKKFRIVVSKEASDFFDKNKNEYVYQFLFDRVAFESGDYDQSRESVLISGPYLVEDTDGLPVNFTKAKLNACTKEPEGSGISFYLSQDQTTWYPVNHCGKTSNYVTFGDNSPTQALGVVDELVNAQGLVTELGLSEDFSRNEEAYLNTYILADYADKVSLRSISLQRGFPTSDPLSGWGKIGNTYATTVYVINPEGRTIDLGPKGAVLNGRKVTGLTLFPSGYSTFQTDVSNWIELDTGLSLESELKAADPLYPYNHKYLIEGYIYPSSFSGQQVYNPADAYFAKRMTYVSNEEFEILTKADSSYWNVFTVEEVGGKLYFKIKVNKRSSTWNSELYKVDFAVANAAVNTLYVKAVLTSSTKKLTPVLESFKVRVI